MRMGSTPKMPLGPPVMLSGLDAQGGLNRSRLVVSWTNIWPKKSVTIAR